MIRQDRHCFARSDRHATGSQTTDSVDRDPGADIGRGAGTRAGVGAAVGTLFGGSCDPGRRPFITAGFLTAALGAVGGGAVAGAVVGGTSGALASASSKWGLDKADADYYATAVESGGTFVAIDVDGTGVSRAEVERVFPASGMVGPRKQIGLREPMDR